MVDMTLFWHGTGPLMYYTDGTLGIEDLNPEMKTRWKMTRWEMLMLGVKCVWASIRG